MSTSYQSSRIYGRRSGRPLNKSREDALENLLPKLSVPHDKVQQKKLIPLADLFDKDFEDAWLEIGFGNGEHLKGLMEQHPRHAYIGAEPFINGMAAFLKDIQDMNHDLIRVWMEDAIDLVDCLEDNCLNGIYVLNPDPWPKSRHHKRRIISQENLTRFSRVLKKNALLIMATDVDDLAEWMASQSIMHPDFEWTAQSHADWTTPPPDWIQTRYEAKGIEAGRRQSYLLFRKT